MNDVPSFGDMRGSFIRRILFRAQKFKGDAGEALIIRRARGEHLLGVSDSVLGSPSDSVTTIKTSRSRRTVVSP